MWPFRSRKSKANMMEMVDKILATQAKKARPRACPDQFKVSNLCACMECPARYTCPIEEVSRACGCETKFIRTCSQKHRLLQENRISAYADHIVESWTKQLLYRFSGEEMDSIYRDLKRRGLVSPDGVINYKKLGGNDAKEDEDEFDRATLPTGG